MLQHLTFEPEGTQPGPYKIALLIKDKAMKHQELISNYIKPLESRNIEPKHIICFNLAYNEQEKAPVSLIKEHLGVLSKALAKLNISHVLVADAAYFKVMCKLRKTDNQFGYVLPTIYAPIRAALTINYQSLFYNPSLKDKLMLSLDALARDIHGDQPLFINNIYRHVSYYGANSSWPKIEQAIAELHDHPELTCDVETYGLHLKHRSIITIAFAWNKHDGAAFDLESGRTLTKQYIQDFFLKYKGKLIFHNAPFDISAIVSSFFNNSHKSIDILDKLYANTEDTQILAYLALNSTSGNKLKLKELAFEYTGNYALDEMENLNIKDKKEVLQYNLTDCLATWFVYEKYKPIVEKEQKEVYENLFLPALKVISQTELTGMPIDSLQLRHTILELHSLKNNAREEIYKSHLVKEFEKILKLDAVLDANAKLKIKRKTVEDFDGLTFNPASTKQLRHLLYDFLKLPVLNTTDTGLPATDGKTINALISHLRSTYNL